MENGKTAMVLVMSLITLTMVSGTATAYSIDGDLTDWGVNLSEDWSLETTWIPSSPTCDWIVEDNIDGVTHPGYVDWTGYSATGVHIEGHGQTYTPYAEPVMGSYVPPVGGEAYDIEAFYFDSDTTNAYFGIVTSMPESGVGDMALDINQDGVYEYGIVLQGSDKGKIYKNPTWSNPSHFPASGPYRITGGSYSATGTVMYTDSGISDNGRTNYVIEISAPRSALGSPSNGELSNLHTTIWCGNDEIELQKVIWEEIPEFATIALPLAATIGLFILFNRRRREEQRVL